jgi:hypothetical protein
MSSTITEIRLEAVAFALNVIVRSKIFHF